MHIRNLINKIVIFFYRVSISCFKKGPHVTRYYMYNYFNKKKKEWPKDYKVLTISGSTNLAKLIGFEDKQISDVSYPEYNVFNLPFEDNKFDAVISDQVLEHVEGEPQKAIDELFRVLKKGGFSLHTTCLINPIHKHPGDFWRFTPDGLDLLTKKHGENVDVGGWGNFYVWIFSYFGLRFEPIPDSRLHPANKIATKNDPLWPIVTWVMTKKTK